MTTTLVTHRSVSQVNQYAQCPYAYKLQRIDRVWQRPAAWLSQGTAVHEAAEAYERSGRTMTLEAMQGVFRDSYVKSISELTDESPNFEYWSASGPYKGEVDVERRYGIGLEQCEKYIDWYAKHPEEKIWITPSGEVGVELGFDIDLDGVRVVGYIDAVVENKEGDLVVRDNKTGAKPGDDFQLATYAVAIAETYGVPQPTKGDYWMGKTGKPTLAHDLSGWSKESVAAVYKEMDQAVLSGHFPPDPEPNKCRFCSVNAACDFRA